MEAIRTEWNVARAQASLWLGDWHPLVRQIAPGEGIAAPASTSLRTGANPSDDAAALHALLEKYKISILVQFELPAVKQACEHARCSRMKELVELDRTMAGASWLKPYEDDSRASGRLHLDRLKPLRDQRGLRRYRTAVETGEANGWHFLVAGAALGLYALPLRQGLMDYALHMFWNVVGQAATRGTLERGVAVDLVNNLASDLPGRIQALFASCKLAAVS